MNISQSITSRSSTIPKIIKVHKLPTPQEIQKAAQAKKQYLSELEANESAFELDAFESKIHGKPPPKPPNPLPIPKEMKSKAMMFVIPTPRNKDKDPNSIFKFTMREKRERMAHKCPCCHPELPEDQLNLSHKPGFCPAFETNRSVFSSHFKTRPATAKPLIEKRSNISSKSHFVFSINPDYDITHPLNKLPQKESSSTIQEKEALKELQDFDNQLWKQHKQQRKRNLEINRMTLLRLTHQAEI